MLRSVPHFLRGPFRIALRIASAEVIATEHVRRVRRVEIVSKDVAESTEKLFRTLQRRSMGSC